MRKTTIEYLCDRCEAQAAKASDLQRFAISWVSPGRRTNKVISIDLCAECQSELLAELERFVTGEALAVLHAMSREEE